MRVLLVAGGTAGHINPALAVADELKKQMPDVDILFAGRKAGMEYELVTNAGYNFTPIEVHGFQRKINVTNIKRNAVALWHLAHAMPAAKKIIKEFKPDICIGFGGYVSGPVVQAAAKLGVKTALHEQNAFPGVTNKLLAKQVDIIFAATQEAANRFARPLKTKVVGNPVRSELFTQNAEEAKAALGLEDKTVILSFGGSLGAAPLNQAIVKLAAWNLPQQAFLQIHATGKAGKAEFDTMMQEEHIAPGELFWVEEYITNMPAMLAVADLVICRAGAITLSELKAVGKASILIPSPYVAENHQYFNAKELEDAGAAIIIEEKDLTAEKLLSTVQTLTASDERLKQMGAQAKTLAMPHTAEEMVQALTTLVKGYTL